MELVSQLFRVIKMAYLEKTVLDIVLDRQEN